MLPRMILASVLAFFAAAPSWADERIIIEHYDCVLMVNQADSEVVRLVFIRDGQVMATRHAHDEMIWGVSGPDFVLIWDDWGPRRAIYFPTLATLIVHGDDPYADGGGEWHCMQRNMRNLKDAP